MAMAFYELRQYTIRPGKMEAWLRCMQEEIIPFQVAKGMVITGSYRGEQDDSVYVWMRRFESETERERLYKAVYESEHWKNVIAPKVTELIDRSAINVQRIVPTRLSTAQ
jgi:NIPSNAP